MKQQGYIRALVSKGEQATKIEWANDDNIVLHSGKSGGELPKTR
jgi:hypothetical protein